MLFYDCDGNYFMFKTGQYHSCMALSFAASLYQKLIDMLKLNINHYPKIQEKLKSFANIQTEDRKIQYQSTSTLKIKSSLHIIIPCENQKSESNPAYALKSDDSETKQTQILKEDQSKNPIPAYAANTATMAKP